MVKVCNFECSLSKSGVEKMDCKVLQEPMSVVLIKMKIFIPRILPYHHPLTEFIPGHRDAHTYIHRASVIP